MFYGWDVIEHGRHSGGLSKSPTVCYHFMYMLTVHLVPMFRIMVLRRRQVD